MFIPFLARADLERLNVAAGLDNYGTVSDAGAGTGTMTVLTGRRYFVSLQSDVSLETIGPVQGLNISINIFSDPDFSLNAAFAGANLTPEVAESFTIERQFVTELPVEPVPLPGIAIGILTLALGALVARRW